MKLVKSRAHAKPLSKPLRVLVIEDDFELSAIIERVLKSLDPSLCLDWVTSAEAAMVQLESLGRNRSTLPYDFIVADIFLHGESTGIDFWRSCQDLFPDTPILITSALSLDRFFQTVGRHSISPPYLQKPFTMMECKQMFETMLRYTHSNTEWFS